MLFRVLVVLGGALAAAVDAANKDYRDLSGFITSGNLTGGRAEARIPEILGKKSYSGFFTVDERYTSAMFFWYFPVETEDNLAPVVLWLNGGPGTSSMYGLLLENGPLNINLDGTLSLREYSWTKKFHVLYIDNPVGTGYSFTRSDSGYSRDADDCGRNLYSAVLQFFQLFPDLQENDFYISGESYAGKYVPGLAHQIHINNPSASTKINMRGIAMGNAMSDPINQYNIADFYYQIGIVDWHQLDTMHDSEKQVRDLINEGKWGEATDVGLHYMSPPVDRNTPSIVEQLTGFKYIYNFLEADHKDAPWEELTQSEAFQRFHRLGNVEWQTNTQVLRHFRDSMMETVKQYVAEIAENYKVLIYNGQLDLCINYRSTTDYLRKLSWSGATEYLNNNREIWYDDGDIAGYLKRASSANGLGSLTEVMVRNAGHLVPQDQPKWALKLYTNFIFDQEFQTSPDGSYYYSRRVQFTDEYFTNITGVN